MNHANNQSAKFREQAAVTLYSKALVSQSQQNFDLAISEFTEAIQIDPDYALAYFSRGLIYQNQPHCLGISFSLHLPEIGIFAA